MVDEKNNILTWLEVYELLVNEPSAVVSSEDGDIYRFEERSGRIKKEVNGRWRTSSNVLPRIKYTKITTKEIFDDLPKQRLPGKTKGPCCGG